MPGKFPLFSPALVIASHNPGKIEELHALLKEFNQPLLSSNDLDLEEPEETAPDFEGNALLKAEAATRTSNCPALADDSGFCVEALGCAPGVLSARWAGPERDFSQAIKKVEEAWRAKGPEASRSAKFVCVIALAWPGGKTLSFRGEVFGRLVFPPRGKEGFGYDPIFLPKGHNRTFGEMRLAEKLPLTHRAKALEKLKTALRRETSRPKQPPDSLHTNMR